MARTFMFYDLETSGVHPAYSRIMQFAGQRTDLDLKPIGPVTNLLVKLPEDVLPEPEAILVHGITPQKTLAEGVSERDFARMLAEEIFTPDTIAVGYNNIRFDDEFIRHLFWRNFYDPYEWHYQDGRSRWDLLDLTRMTRALRPDGLNWPFNQEGRPVNRLEPLAQANGVAIARMHDAESDILSTLEWARKLKSTQAKLFEWLFNARDKQTVAQVINSAKPLSRPFVYSSGSYPGEYEATTIAVVLGVHPTDSSSVLVYDLRHNPKAFADLTAQDLSSRLFVPREKRKELTPLPVKKLALNRAPAVAPLGTLDQAASQRIGLPLKTAEQNLKLLAGIDGFYERVAEAFERAAKPPKRLDPEGQLYDGFLNDKDKAAIRQVRTADADQLADFQPEFIDERLGPLLLRYKARNLPFTLSQSEQSAWEGWRTEKLLKGVDKSLNLKEFWRRLAGAAVYAEDKDQQFLLEELKLYAESIAPAQLFDV